MRAYHSTMLAVADELIESWDRRVGTGRGTRRGMTN